MDEQEFEYNPEIEEIDPDEITIHTDPPDYDAPQALDELGTQDDEGSHDA